MTVVTSYGGNVVAGHEPGTHRGPGAQDLKGRVVIGTGGTISNSAAVDEDNDIYVATCQMLHKLVWTGSTLSQVAAGDAWCTAYPTINTYYTLFLSSSGSAPALMGFGRNNDAQ